MGHDSTFGERRQAARLRRLARNRQTQGQVLRTPAIAISRFW
jgi:hypothetical protein